jgi:hypothetical protein
MNISVPPVRASEPLPVQTIDVFTDTRDILAHARKDAHQRGFADWLICDIDAHHFETVSWSEIVEYIEDPVVRDNAVRFQKDRIGIPYGLNGDLGLRYQSVGGRIPHQDGQREKIETTDVHRDVVLTRRAMDSLGIDYMVVFRRRCCFSACIRSRRWRSISAAPTTSG